MWDLNKRIMESARSPYMGLNLACKIQANFVAKQVEGLAKFSSLFFK